MQTAEGCEDFASVTDQKFVYPVLQEEGDQRCNGSDSQVVC